MGHTPDEHQSIVWHRYFKEVHAWQMEKTAGARVKYHDVEIHTVKADIKTSLDTIMEKTSADPS